MAIRVRHDFKLTLNRGPKGRRDKIYQQGDMEIWIRDGI